ncbi:MAG: efflux RND transporter periplasmic adaptor subunit [Sterolibacteriaceae bacterium]|uniref:Efflux RND transporter periplasmic adaptor subunit n=1 Tax=Candidatus Methylophosphatis roskildensis TaxID=2899263 RepID=A0A9D7DVU4_9PROT|nr:efflux RND transporter periplasmic adaptor subunit [Candidatus Methylophosphatis roskildensis]
MKGAPETMLAVLLGAAIGAGAYALYSSRQAAPAPVAPVAGDAASMAKPAAEERKVLYWHDPMVPGQRFDKPGKSPFMDMDLVPVYDDQAAAGTVAVDPRVLQNIGVRYANVESRSDAPQLAAVGNVRFDETRTVSLQARVGGYIERQSVRATGQPVTRGQVLAEITAPEFVQAQDELLLARRLNDALLVDAARSRLSLLGMSDRQIDELAASGRVQRSVAIIAPASGIVTEIVARPGMNVAAGAPLFVFAALDSVWVVAEVPERDAASIASGSAAQISFPAFPGESFKGRVEFIYPDVTAATRTASVRIALPNPRGRLRPGMLATVQVGGATTRPALWLPSEAVITTGNRSLVLLAEEPGRFRPVDVVTGAERDGRIEIRQGLAEGARVVASGQFLIDSEASLKGVLTRMTPESPPGAPSAALAQGRVDAIDRDKLRITLSHGVIPSVSMPAMTMGFPVDPPALLQGVEPGQQVEFDVVRRDGDLVVTTLRAHGAAQAHRH